jgi:hypothetical protein
VGIKLIRLVDQPHHQLRLARMNKLRLQSRLFDLIDDPIPITRSFDGYSRALPWTFEALSNGPRAVLHSKLLRSACFNIFSLYQRVALVGIKCYKFFHARLLSSGEDFRQFNLTVGVALSYFHSGEGRNPVFSDLLDAGSSPA